MADGTTFEVNVAANATGVDAAASAVTNLASQLDAAGKAATAAADEVKAGQLAYNQAESAANKAATALEKIGLAVESQRGKAASIGAEYGVFSTQFQKASDKLQALTAAQAAAQAKATSTAAAMNSEAAALDKLKTAAGGAAASQANVSKALDQAKAKAAAAQKAQEAAAGSGKANEAAEGFAKLGGPLGAIGQKAFGAADALKKLSGSLGEAGPYAAVAIAIVAIVTAIVAVTAAAIAGVAAIASWAVELADAARNHELLSDGIAGSAKGGRALDQAIASLEKRVPQTTSELEGMAAELAKTGLRGEALSSALEDAAVKAATLKFGPDFAKGANSLLKLTERLKASIGKIFGGLKIDALLDSLSKIVNVFDSGSASAEAIKTVFESLFQPLIDGVVAFVPKMISAFIQFEILVLKALIAIKPFGEKIKLVAEAFGILAAVIAVLTVGFFVAVVTPFVILAAIVGGVVAGIVAFAYALYSAVSAAISFGAGIIDSVKAPLQGVMDWLGSLSLSSIGTSLIDGLIAGITGAGGGVLKAITGIATGAIDAAKSALGIASPSKVFAEIGGHTAAGMEEGVDDGAAGVQGSLKSLVEPPDAKAPGVSAGAVTAKASGGPLVHIENLILQSSTDDPKGFAEAFRAHLADLVTQISGGTPDAG